jgi:predicted DNA-binding transcriptional regulator AlpA
MAKRFIPFNEGLKLLGVSRSEGYRQQKTNPEFPKIVKPLGKGSKPSALDLDEVEAYQAARLRERDEAAA